MAHDSAKSLRSGTRPPGGFLHHGLLLGFLLVTLAVNAAVSPGTITEAPLAVRSGPKGATLFATLPATDTGILVENNYADSAPDTGGRKDSAAWADRYHTMHYGAFGTGVAIGDYDGDGRPDIFVVSKTETCRLFRNLGNWKFEEVTDKAGVGDKGETALIWKQGATYINILNVIIISY